MIISKAHAYKLVIVQGLSDEKQTFLTRNNDTDKLLTGQKVTFTSENVSVIATAKTVTREFTQWKLDNTYSDIPFQKGQILTMYDAQEYLWTLNPEAVKRKYVKSKIYKRKNSFEAQFGFTRGLSESTSEALPQSTNRSGLDFKAMLKHDININWALAYGLRYTREVVNLPSVSIINYRFMGILEGRYYIDPMPSIFDSQLGVSVAVGYGQSRTEEPASAIFGSSMLLPGFNALWSIPVYKKFDIEFSAGIESYRLDEENAVNENKSTNLSSTSIGATMRFHL